jgi:putative oxidoreductase
MKRFFSTQYSQFSFNLSMFLLRAGSGAILFYNFGLHKLLKFSEMKDGFSDPLHIGHTYSLILIIFAEVFCALLLVAGLMTRFAAFALVAAFIIIVFIVHKNSPVNQYVDAILFLLAFITILFCGPGKWSLDKMIGK